ncbi:MAG: TIGR02147 family protein [Polyangiaceae bacterium]|nr:TIGR02147 family protein [Polyangiaceae bacterium]
MAYQVHALGVSKTGSVNILEYLDYRACLRDHYAERKANEYGFSHRSFSKRAGLRSSNYLKLVMDGERNLTPEMAHQFATACGLQGTALDFFCELVAYGQAENAVERIRCHERLARYKQYRAIHKLDVAQSAYHSTWYLPAIRELAVGELTLVASSARPRSRVRGGLVGPHPTEPPRGDLPGVACSRHRARTARGIAFPMRASTRSSESGWPA